MQLLRRKILAIGIKKCRCWERQKCIDEPARGPGKGMDHEMGILVRQRKKKGQPGRPALKIGIAITASAVMSAGAASLLTAGGSGPVVLPYATMAAINTSNTTVGFADSDIIGMSQADIDRTLDQMQAMGVQNVRILIPWNNVEPVNNYFY